MPKKQWTAPAVEILDIDRTMFGNGTTIVDVVTSDDFDVRDIS